ncbi:hypothetical protein FB451DRAFT_1029636, partial [Mycena latifolia]
IIALYKNPPRTWSTTPTGSRALAFLDDVLGALGLISVDTHVPDVCCYTPDDVCPGPACLSLPPGSPARDFGTVGSSAVPWAPARDPRADEVRRPCWRAECMSPGHVDGGVGMVMCEPSHVRPFSSLPYILYPHPCTLLFPNEVYDRKPGGRPCEDAMNAIWALFCRSMLLAQLWAGGVQQSHTEARLETQALQEALGAHGCNLYTAVAYLLR